MDGLFFGNYQKVKLVQTAVESQNLLLLLLFAALIVLSLRRVPATAFLSPRQSLQLRGLVSLVVVIGHLWGHVAGVRPLLITQGETVHMFLFLSGFGLTMSFNKGYTDHRWFLKRRLVRVMVPYWIITAILLPLDHFLLSRDHTAGELLMTLAGINTTTRLNHIDYGRWYVTVLLIWYALFFISYHLLRGRRAGWVLFAGSLLLFFVYRRYTFVHQFFAFPIGVLCAAHYPRIADLALRRERLLLSLAGGGLLFAVLFKTALLPRLYGVLPYEEGTYLLIKEAVNIVTVLSCVVLMGAAGRRGWESRVLAGCGTVSYEVFLIHGALLIKYNPVFPHFDTTAWGIVPAFVVWALFLYGVAFLINRLFKMVT